MKKILMMLLAITLTLSFAACGSEKKEVSEGDGKSEALDTTEVYEAYMAAYSSVFDSDYAKFDLKTKLTDNDGLETDVTENNSSVQRISPVEGGLQLAMDTTTVVSGIGDGKMEESFKEYYRDGYLYSDYSTDKTKLKASEEDAIAMTGTGDYVFTQDAIKSFEQSDSKLSFVLDPQKSEILVGPHIAWLVDMEDDLIVTAQDVTLIALLKEDGTIESVEMTIPVVLREKDEDDDWDKDKENLVIFSKMSNINTEEFAIEFPADLDQYRDILTSTAAGYDDPDDVHDRIEDSRDIEERNDLDD